MSIKKEGTPFLVMLYFPYSDHLESTKLCSGYRRWTAWVACSCDGFTGTRYGGRTNVMCEILGGLSMYYPERIMHHGYFMNYLRDHTQKVIWLLLICRVWGDDDFYAWGIPWHEVFRSTLAHTSWLQWAASERTAEAESKTQCRVALPSKVAVSFMELLSTVNVASATCWNGNIWDTFG